VVGYATAGLNASCPSRSTIAGEGGCFFLLSRENSGTGTGYANMAKVDMVDPDKTPILNNSHPVILGSQGYGCGNGHGFNHSCVSYDSLYGHFPAAAAIDIGAACLSLRNKALFMPPGRLAVDNNMIPGVPETILCLKPGNNTLWGAVTLESKTPDQETP
jgi:hypothetical protein